MHRGFIGTRLTLITQKQECCAYLLLTSFHPTLRPDARSRRWRMEPSGVHDNWIMIGFFGRHATNLVHYQKQLVLAEHAVGSARGRNDDRPHVRLGTALAQSAVAEMRPVFSVKNP